MEKSFNPILGVQPKVLILGSLPGKESLRIQQYYGNVRNAFWKILFSLFDEELEGNYTAKKEFLIKNKMLSHRSFSQAPTKPTSPPNCLFSVGDNCLG